MPDPRPPALTERSRRTVRRGAKFDFEVVTLAARSGHTLERECVRHPGAVVILPLFDDPPEARLVLVRNHRFTLGRRLLELPAGTIEPPESPEQTARRETLEETGYLPATITPLTRFHTSPGMSDETMWAFVARGLTKAVADAQDDEDLEPVILPASEALLAARAGELEDAKTILTLLLASDLGLI